MAKFLIGNFKGPQGLKGEKGDTGAQGPKGDTGDIGIGTVIKGQYTTYEEFVNVHPTG